MVWFSEVDLRMSAGPTSFERGQDLVDAVADVRTTPTGVRAVVHGEGTYAVFLGPTSPGLAGECGCPVGESGRLCEHCVAVGLVLLGARDYAGAVRSLGTAAPQILVLRRQLDESLRVRGSVDKDGSQEYARIADEVLDTVSKLIESGHAAEARPLARRAVDLITDGLLLIDDASGLVGAACQRALGLYARACAAARPNPVKLAGWLFQLQLTSPGWPAVDLADFAGALGDAGLTSYRTLVADAWDSRSDDGDIRHGLTLLLMRERLAKLDGAQNTVVDVLPNPAAFLGVAAGDPVPWLVEFLVQAYLNGGRGQDALELRRFQLTTTPARVSYAKLKETAAELHRWSRIRPWALDVLHAAADRRGSGDELVGALLDDGEPDEAWQAAEKYGCPGPVWLSVARLRGDGHPADVLPGYRLLVEAAAARTGRRHYREAVGLLGELRNASKRCGQLAEFREFVEVLRVRHRRKPALQDELDRAALD